MSQYQNPKETLENSLNLSRPAGALTGAKFLLGFALDFAPSRDRSARSIGSGAVRWRCLHSHRIRPTKLVRRYYHLIFEPQNPTKHFSLFAPWLATAASLSLRHKASHSDALLPCKSTHFFAFRQWKKEFFCQLIRIETIQYKRVQPAPTANAFNRTRNKHST